MTANLTYSSMNLKALARLNCFPSIEMRKKRKIIKFWPFKIHYFWYHPKVIRNSPISTMAKFMIWKPTSQPPGAKETLIWSRLMPCLVWANDDASFRDLLYGRQLLCLLSSQCCYVYKKSARRDTYKAAFEPMIRHVLMLWCTLVAISCACCRWYNAATCTRILHSSCWKQSRLWTNSSSWRALMNPGDSCAC